MAFVGALRERVGPKMGILFDVGQEYRHGGIIQLGRALEPFDLYWLEAEGFDADALLTARRGTRTRLCHGEALIRREQFRPFLERHVTDVVMVEVLMNGLTEARRICELAAHYDTMVSPHNYMSPLSTLVNAHLYAAMPNFEIFEIDMDDVPWKWDLIDQTIEIVDGELIVPSRPGLGANIVESEVAKHPLKEHRMTWNGRAWRSATTRRPATARSSGSIRRRSGADLDRALNVAAPAFESVWVSDHLMTEDRFRLECWTELTWIAARFPEPLLGTIVMANSYRHPAADGQDGRVAAVPERRPVHPRLRGRLGRGRVPRLRLRLPVGAGRGSTRWSRASRSSGRSGRAARRTTPAALPADRGAGDPGPGAAPADHDRRRRRALTLRAVATHADWWNAMSRPMDVLRHKIEVLEEHCATVGRDPASILRTTPSSSSSTPTARPPGAPPDRASRASPGLRRRPGRPDRPSRGAGRARLRPLPAGLPALPGDLGHRALPRRRAPGVPLTGRPGVRDGGSTVICTRRRLDAPDGRPAARRVGRRRPRGCWPS